MFTLATVVPWGRSFDEYRRMFALTGADAARPILGCADGPASFNAEATARGWRVTSCDPLYRCSADEIRARIAATFAEVIDQTRRNADEFVWDAQTIPSIDALARMRAHVMTTFLGDFDSGRRGGRYLDAELPALPFGDGAFSLALCSHFLFLYTAQLTEAFHIASLRELGRVADEVRIFPLLALGGMPSPHLPVAVEALRRDGLEVALEAVPYEFQRGGNQMMRIVTRPAARADRGRTGGA
jgi:hypothetical protein